MNGTELKVLRCNSIAELEEQIYLHESRGWERTGRMDILDGVFMHILKLETAIDDTEEITQELS